MKRLCVFSALVILSVAGLFTPVNVGVSTGQLGVVAAQTPPPLSSALGELYQQGYLKSLNPMENAEFGRNLALEGNTLVVASQGENQETGAVYVFERVGLTWNNPVRLQASDASAGGTFAHAVAISEDTIVIGAHSWTLDVGQGAVYIFVRKDGSWVEQAKLLQPTSDGVDDCFGCAVAISGNRLAVAASREDGANDSLMDSGAVYVFVRNNGLWTQEAYIKSPTGAAFVHFGVSVSILGDRIAVGSPWASGKNGAVHLFERNGIEWLHKSSYTSGAYQSYFGVAVALSEDALAVGAMLENVPSEMAGAVYIFDQISSGLKQPVRLQPHIVDANDQFGYDLALAGNVLLVGAPREDGSGTGINSDSSLNNAEYAGAAYLFRRQGGVWVQEAYIKASNTEVLDSFGESVAMSGATYAIGAFLEKSNASGVDGNQADNSLYGAGAVYTFARRFNYYFPVYAEY